MYSPGCDSTRRGLGSRPESFSLAEKFCTALGEPRKPWRRATGGVRALPSFLTLDGSRLSRSAARGAPLRPAHRGLHPKARDVSGLSCGTASLPEAGRTVPGSNDPIGAPGANLCLERRGMLLSPPWNTAAPHAEPITEVGEIHGRYPGLPNLADMFFMSRERKHIQRIRQYSIVWYFPHTKLKGGFLEA